MPEECSRRCGGKAAVDLGGSAEPSLKEPSVPPTPLFPQSKGLKVPSLVGVTGYPPGY